ncbi:MAG TPA: hypothetical protein VJN68_07040 [Burkholderiaceae bacterium]|nr:hypothetical protein [Burkholderiaceae bacterium]
MNIEQLTGRYFRLRQELAVAYASVPRNTGLIDRLIDDLAATEREMAAASVGCLRVVEPPAAASDSPRFGAAR